MNKIAVVIPAYKATFLNKALESLEAQTDQRFSTYIFDDGSRDNLREICDLYTDTLNLKYYRFTENLGNLSLPLHWNRCIEQTTEEWVWLFSDDDVASSKCIASFYDSELEDEKFSVLCFDSIVIDKNGTVIRINPPNPDTEFPIEYLYHRLMGDRFTYAPDHIFHRDAFDRCGGFRDLPLAWCADDIAWYEFSNQLPIKKLYGGKIYWRLSGCNLSSDLPYTRKKKQEGVFEFARWAIHHMGSGIISEHEIQKDMLDQALARWLLQQISSTCNYSEICNLSSRIMKIVVNVSVERVVFKLFAGVTMRRINAVINKFLSI